MQIKKVVQIVALVSLVSMPTFGQRIQPNVARYNPQQMFAAYQTWFNNANMQIRQQIAMMPPAMQLQCSIRAIEGELSQWGGFLQQYYPMVYANRSAQLQQCRQWLAQIMNGGYAPVRQPTVIPSVQPKPDNSLEIAALQHRLLALRMELEDARANRKIATFQGTGWVTASMHEQQIMHEISDCERQIMALR